MEIVERRQSNGTSLKDEERYRAVFTRADIGIGLVDRDGRIIESNSALQQMLGYSAEELRGIPLYEITHPEDIEPGLTLFRDLLAGKRKNYRLDKRYRRKNGEIMWGRLSVSLLREAEDRPVCAVGILEDITDRKLATQALEERLAFEQLLTDLSTRFIGLSADQLDSVIADAQRQICACLGIDVCSLWKLSPDDPDSLRLAQYHAPPDAPPVPTVHDGKDSYPWCLKKLLAGESIILSRVTDAPAAAARDLENWKHFGIKSVLVFPVATGGGAVFAAVGFLAIRAERDWPADLVKRLQLLAQIFAGALARERAEQALRDSRSQFQLLADSAPVLVWMAGTDRRCTYFNRLWLEFTGRSLEQETGDGWVEGIHPEDRQRCMNIYARAFDAREPFTMEYRLRHHDGEYRWVMDNGVPLFDADRRFTGYIGSCVDITGRKQAELESHILHLELSRVARMATMGELTASLAHELNQPLTAILSNAQTVQRLLDNPAPDVREIREILGDIVSDDQRAGDIIRGVRNMLKKSELDFQSLDLNDVIREVIGLIRSDALVRKVTLASRLAPEMPNVRGDRIQLQQLMLNLAINAFDAMMNIPENERRLEIVTTKINAHLVQVGVHDSGKGIPPGHLEKVFEPFVTDKSQGMGMGLAICRSIAHAHGGRIWAGNNSGRGAAFRLELPVNEDAIP